MSMPLSPQKHTCRKRLGSTFALCSIPCTFILSQMCEYVCSYAQSYRKGAVIYCLFSPSRSNPEEPLLEPPISRTKASSSNTAVPLLSGGLLLSPISLPSHKVMRSQRCKWRFPTRRKKERNGRKGGKTKRERGENVPPEEHFAA